MNNNFNQFNQGEGNQQQFRTSYDNHAEIEIIGNIAGIKDQNGNQVNAISKPMRDGAKVANTNIAVNIPGRDEADFWKLEVWGYPQQSRYHNFLMEHCQVGRKVFVKGTPVINKGNDGRLFPTIRVTKLIGLSSPAGNNNANNQQNDESFQQPQQQNQFNGFPQNQGGFNQQQSQPQGFQAPPQPFSPEPPQVQQTPFGAPQQAAGYR